MEDYLSAISRLFILSSDKRHQIKDFKFNFSDSIGILAQEINNEIYSKIKIDIFKSQLFESIILYERELNFLFTKYSSENIIEDKELEDELYLLKSFIVVENTYFQDNNFDINTKFKKDIKQKFAVTMPTIFAAAKKPDYLHRIVDVEFGDNFFATAVEKNVILIYHLAVNRENKKMIDIQTILTFNISKYKNNPTRLFLNVLDDYGIDLTIDNETRRFFKYVKILNKNVQGELNLIHAPEIGKDSFSIQTNLMRTEYGAIVKYAYGINHTIYLEE
jgi:hypothetical protein